jgi:hypothetical protein
MSRLGLVGRKNATTCSTVLLMNFSPQLPTCEIGLYDQNSDSLQPLTQTGLGWCGGRSTLSSMWPVCGRCDARLAHMMTGCRVGESLVIRLVYVFSFRLSRYRLVLWWFRGGLSQSHWLATNELRRVSCETHYKITDSGAILVGLCTNDHLAQLCRRMMPENT